jgi:molecular chaperone DnaK
MTTFGIDLGTTNSCIAYVDGAGSLVIVRNALAELTTPSVVYFETPDSISVGQDAKDVALLAPHLVTQFVKREMGVPDRAFSYHRRSYTPEMISAFILRYLVESAEQAVNEPVRDVVITVPAYFGVAEREATRRAGEIAGLNVLELLPEPVAAALSYSQHERAAAARHVLVFDLGGGTFDTTVIRLADGEVSVVCTGGDRRLGGTDWDQRIEAYLLTEFARQYPRLDPSADEQFMQDVRATAESMKRDLSSRSARPGTLRFGDVVAEVELSRDKLEQLADDLLERALDITGKTLAEAQRRGVAGVSEAILVGGMTRMPVVGARLKERFGLETRHHEPDFAVARGAALFARMAGRQRPVGLSPPGVSFGDDGDDRDGGAEEGRAAVGDAVDARGIMRVATVVPRGLGVKVVDQNDPNFPASPLQARWYIVHVLPANTPLPASAGPVRFATGMDNQPGVDIEVWEQEGTVESEELADNARIGIGKLRSLIGLPAGSPIDVTFSMSETGTLTVHAVEPGSGKQVRFDLQIGGMDQAAVNQARTTVAQHRMRA